MDVHELRRVAVKSEDFKARIGQLYGNYIIYIYIIYDTYIILCTCSSEATMTRMTLDPRYDPK